MIIVNILLIARALQQNNSNSIADYQTIISAIIAGAVSLSIGYLTYRRINRATTLERKERAQIRQEEQEKAASEAANDQIVVIQAAWESVVQQLRDEIDRLLLARKAERHAWEEREQTLYKEVDSLRKQVNRCNEKIKALEAELGRVERRQGFYDNRGEGNQDERRGDG